jgi:5-methylcytosine-specific restriction endonuclease McrA
MSQSNPSSAGWHPMPKGPTAKQQRDRRRRERRKLDRAFQEAIPPNARCLIASTCLGPLVRHHIRRRRYRSSRWTEENSIILCGKHHSELHSYGEPKFAAKYGLDLSSISTYVKLPKTLAELPESYRALIRELGKR